MPDSHKNFGYSTVATAPSPATSGTSLVVAAGQGALFGTVPFNVTIWPTGVNPTAANAEIVRVTGIATDTFTIVRAQEGTVARTVVVGDQIAATITAKTLTDAELANTDVTLAADRTIDLNGKIFHIAQGANDFLILDPTVDNEQASLAANNVTGSGNNGAVTFNTNAITGNAALAAVFNGGAKIAQIAAQANASGATLVYTANTHTFNGEVISSSILAKTIFISNANYVL